jgi:hypothetical protein
MPVSKLLVEGDLDEQLLFAVCQSEPLIESARASKDALAPRVRDERRKGIEGVFYLRDRDYDTEPPSDITRPTKDQLDDGHLGWRWCRHSIENYMLDPAIIRPAFDVTQETYFFALTSAASSLRYYQAARWAIGAVRTTLPPKHKLQTQPSKDDFFLPGPTELEKDASEKWLLEHVQIFADQVIPALTPVSVKASYALYSGRFETGFCDKPDNVLLWFSGKNLIVALRDWWSSLGVASPGDFRNHIRDWMWNHPEDVLNALPEWRALLDAMREA